MVRSQDVVPAVPTNAVGPGDELDGRYRLERVLGEGGMGIVFEATQLGLDRRVAVKVLRSSASSHASVRLRREAKSLVQLESDHVARVLDLGELAEIGPYLVMELLEGSDLREVLKERPQLPVDEACWYVAQACVGVAAAHRVGIIHRDLKPANLFLARDSAGQTKVKVLDFGIARTPRNDRMVGEETLTEEGTLLGSPSYMSPEQIMSAAVADERSDVWALGAILYRLLSGAPPFQREFTAALLVAICKDDPTDLRSLRPELPEGLARLVHACLQRDPNDRPQSALSVHESLKAFVNHRPLAQPASTRPSRDSVTTPPTPTLAPVRSDTFRPFRLPLLVAVLLVPIGGAATVAALMPLQEPTDPQRLLVLPWSDWRLKADVPSEGAAPLNEAPIEAAAGSSRPTLAASTSARPTPSLAPNRSKLPLPRSSSSTPPPDATVSPFDGRL
jgi:serine/threonine-protein kinase